MPKHNDEKTAEATARLEKLQALWRRRDRLNEAEWTELYIMVYHILIPPTRRYASLLNDLPGSDGAYIKDFFQQKIFNPTTRENYTARTIYPGALRRFFRHYLLDCLDEVNRQPDRLNQPHPQNPDPDGDDDDLLERLRPEDPTGLITADEGAWLLWEAGLDESTVTASARAFLQRLTPAQRTVFEVKFVQRQALKNAIPHLADASTKTQSATSTANHIAQQLGVAVNRSRFADFHQTDIGQWLSQPPTAEPPGLGLDLTDDENRGVIFVVLQLLRATAASDQSRERPPAAAPVSKPH